LQFLLEVDENQTVCQACFESDSAYVPDDTSGGGEQTIRQVVLDRKVTQRSCSEWGDEWHERF
jgi:hypothetical protein